MNALAETIRELMIRQDMTGAKLAEKIGVSAVSISNILTGKSKPRQVTLSRIMNRLCQSKEEEHRVITAYECLDDEMNFFHSRRVKPASENEIERVTRYMKEKSFSIAFHEDVELVIQDAGVLYERNYRKTQYISDFLISLGGRRVAIECKYNVNGDWDETITAIQLLRERLTCDSVIIVIPYTNEITRREVDHVKANGGMICALADLAETIKGGET